MLDYLFLALLLGVIAAVAAFDEKSEILWVKPVIAGVLSFLFFGFNNYWWMPTLSFWGFDGVWIEFTLAAIIGLLFSTYDGNGLGSLLKWQAIPLGICISALFVRCGSSAEMFHSREYHELLKPQVLVDSTAVVDSTFANAVHPIPVEKTISVKREYAEDLGSKRIENMPSLGSCCHFGQADMINLNGTFNVKTAEGKSETLTFDNEKVWVMPLEHSGFWKWRNNKVTKGYCIVSAHDPGRVFFVTELEGKPLKLRYLRSGCFGDEIERYLRTNGYASYGLTEYSMELNDEGRPYWVITVYEPTIGFGGEDATGVLVVDMQTGQIEEYAIADAPKWVDRIQPDEFLLDQIDDWGQYQKGWWNSWAGQDSVRKATPGMSLVYSDGKSYWYSGIQSAGADKSSSGFMLIDTRTKECKLYPVAGINEQAAKEVIEAQSEWVRMSNFMANDPVLYNIHGVPTYYMTLTGDGIKNAGYAFVSLKSELIFAAAATPQKALQQYLNVLQSGGQFKISDGDKITEEILKMTVRGIVCENGTYYVLFNEFKGKEFMGTTESFPELKWTKEGQKVKVSFTDTNAKVIVLNSFDNCDFDI